MTEQKTRNKKKHRIIVMNIIALILLLGCIGYIFNYYKTQKEAKIVYEKMQQEIEEQRIEEQRIDEEQRMKEQRMQPETEESAVDILMDFTKLQEQNPDIYAWISIPGTEVDYPILQSAEDNAYYLNHRVDKVEAKVGSIYTENYNTKSFDDNNTVIYGHNMRDGSMFASLHEYRDNLFLEENPYIRIYTSTQVLKYEIFAAYVSDDKHIMLSYDFSDQFVYQNYLDEILSMRNMNALINKELQITSENKIITLSTCNSVSTERWIIQAVLIEEE